MRPFWLSHSRPQWCGTALLDSCSWGRRGGECHSTCSPCPSAPRHTAWCSTVLTRSCGWPKQSKASLMWQRLLIGGSWHPLIVVPLTPHLLCYWEGSPQNQVELPARVPLQSSSPAQPAALLCASYLVLSAAHMLLFTDPCSIYCCAAYALLHPLCAPHWPP